ncbi:MAG: bifunctional 4-hydroxy-2-oxoglutarate aldolase/2-dehydro-3-deoxy-phosphogluconate aldolase [Victivallaceae bacterium]|nr:bifunctional 4-hydroxy-2-oxoglutarate aldolase/2-dehydro-3-deoxy-phosphogluconate aldolase [Victivallaceae bacterium]
MIELFTKHVVPVLVLKDVDEGLKMCEILMENNLPVAEITFRTAAAAEIIAKAAVRFPEMLLGAGTILNVADLDRAIYAGAKFAVAPGFNPTVVRAAFARKFPFAPGIATPSEIEQGYELGCRFFKFFPAEAAGGVEMLKAISAPYKHLGLKFMPTGGVNTKNAVDYLAIPEVAAVGGTWLGKAAPDWEKVAAVVREAAAL